MRLLTAVRDVEMPIRHVYMYQYDCNIYVSKMRPTCATLDFSKKAPRNATINLKLVASPEQPRESSSTTPVVTSLKVAPQLCHATIVVDFQIKVYISQNGN